MPPRKSGHRSGIDAGCGSSAGWGSGATLLGKANQGERRWIRVIRPRQRPIGRRSRPSWRSTCRATGPASARLPDERREPWVGGVAAAAGRQRPHRPRLAHGVRRRWPVRHRAGGAARGARQGGGAHGRPERRLRHGHDRPHDHGDGHRGAEASLPAPDPVRAGHAGARATPSRTPGRTWRRSAPSAVLDGDEWVINGQKIWTSEGHTANWIFVLCRTDSDCAQAQGHLVPAVPDGPARYRGPAHHQHHRQPRLQRGVLQRRPHRQGVRRRWGQRGLAGGQPAARLRAGRRRHHRLLPHAGGRRRAATGSPGSGPRPGPARPPAARVGPLQGRDPSLPGPAHAHHGARPTACSARSPRSTSCSGASCSRR